MMIIVLIWKPKDYCLELHMIGQDMNKIIDDKIFNITKGLNMNNLLSVIYPHLSHDRNLKLAIPCNLGIKDFSTMHSTKKKSI